MMSFFNTISNRNPSAEVADFPNGKVCEKLQKLVVLVESEFQIQKVDGRMVTETGLSFNWCFTVRITYNK